MALNKSKWGREKKVEFGPQLSPKPTQKFLTTKGLILRGIIFIASVTGACYLLWQEFSGK